MAFQFLVSAVCTMNVKSVVFGGGAGGGEKNCDNGANYKVVLVKC